MVKMTRRGDITGSMSKESKSNAIVAQKESLDLSLAQLFASSSGPVRTPPTTRYENAGALTRPPVTNTSADVDFDTADLSSEGTDEDLSSVEEDLEEAASLLAKDDNSDLPEFPELNRPRKRKRDKNVDDVEGKYMLRLAKEDEKEETERNAKRLLKRQRLTAEEQPDTSDLDGAKGSSKNDKVLEQRQTQVSAMASDIPQHESLAPGNVNIELEKSARTVFLANVSTKVITDKKAKKVLLDHMATFFNSIPPPLDGSPTHKVESIRFRSTAYAGTGLPKKAAFATKNLMDTTTKSTNAYVVYSTAFAAREAVKKLNGTMILDRHLRVDGVAHPAKVDHRRCVFVGNLGFVDDESMMEQGDEGQRRRSKIPSDIEEGLWRQFGKAGSVESVRVIRDEKTRVGKGFAYVQFEDANSVEAALLFHEKKYPPMLPRVLRVTRAKSMHKTALAALQKRSPTSNEPRNTNRDTVYNPKVTSQQQSLQGRAGKLLGRAGAAKFKRRDLGRSAGAIMKTPESVVFEGYRASAKSGRPKDLKLGGRGGGKKSGTPRTRSSRRGTEWKKSGRKSGK